MQSEKVLITVKTYPTLSTKYGELACTAGIKENGTWVRIYPIPFRRLKDDYQFKKYQWIEIPLIKNPSDSRPESYKPTDLSAIKRLDSIGTSDNWRERRQFILNEAGYYESIEELISLAQDKNELSLATFKPKEIIDFYWQEEEEKFWDKKKLDQILADINQPTLFEEEEFKDDFKIVDKLPYKFKYKFTDINGKTCDLGIIDWEIGALYWNCLKTYKSEETALQKVKEKYWDEFTQKRDIYLYLGTMKQYHSWSNNPFTIIGAFTPPIDNQLSFNCVFPARVYE